MTVTTTATKTAKTTTTAAMTMMVAMEEEEKKKKTTDKRKSSYDSCVLIPIRIFSKLIFGESTKGYDSITEYNDFFS